MNIDANAVILALIAAVPGTIVAVGSYRTSVRNRRAIVKQEKEVKSVEQTANRTANKVDAMHAETQRFMQTVAIDTAAFKAAQAKRRASGFGDLDP